MINLYESVSFLFNEALLIRRYIRFNSFALLVQVAELYLDEIVLNFESDVDEYKGEVTREWEWETDDQ